MEDKGNISSHLGGSGVTVLGLVENLICDEVKRKCDRSMEHLSSVLQLLTDI